METKVISLKDEELLIILNRLALGTENFNKAVTEENHLAELEAIDNVSLKKVSALYNKLLFHGQDGNNIVIVNALDSLNWLTKDCIDEVIRLWALPRVNDNTPNPRVKALQLIIALGTENGFKINLTKSVEIKDKILKKYDMNL